MSTPDAPGLDGLELPSETTHAQRQVPRPASPFEVPAHHAPTPGVTLGALKLPPSAPTLPDPVQPSPAAQVDVTSVLTRLANEFFRAPPLAQSPSEPPVSSSPAVPPAASAPLTPPPASAPPLPPSSAPPLVPLASAVPTSPSPFSAPLDLRAFAGPALTVPVLRDASPALAWPTHELQPVVPGLRDGGRRLFDAHALKREFPILQERVNGRELVWLDNAATTQKPRAVIDRLTRFYERENSNIHRAAHTLAARATDAYEGAREAVRRFINAPAARDVVFVRGTTEGINLVAQSWGRRNIGAGDEIVVSWLEHHANIVPWQQLAAEKGAKLRVAPVDDDGQIILEEYEKLLGPKTRLVSFTQVSNALGTITPARQMVELAHRHGACVLVDGAQSVSHLPTDVQALGCDFFVFSGHKVFAPTGIGVVYGRSEVLDATPPWQGGGNMIRDVTFEKTLYQPAPARFEAGTGNIADAVGLGAALDWLSQLGVDVVAQYEHALLEYATAKLAEVPGLTLYGTAPDKAGVLSFVLDGRETTQVGALLDREGIAVRSGHHCAQPILRRFGVEATVRASLAPYNTHDDVDALVAALTRLQEGR